jgi:hypothetical protein
MRRSFLRQALVVLAAGALFLPMAIYHGDTAQAASISFPSTCSMSGPDGNGNFQINCQTTGGPGLPGGCSIGYSPSSNVAANITVTMTVNCTTGAPFTSYAWTGGSVVGAGTSGSVTPAASVNGNVNVTNSAGSTAVPWSVTVGSGGGGPPGGPDTTACRNLGLNPKVVVMNWNGGTIKTGNSGGFGANDALIVQFTTGSFTTSTLTGFGSLSGVEFGGPTTPRSGALSASPCDFSVGMPMYKWSNRNLVTTQCATTAFSANAGPGIGFSVASLPELATQKSTSCQALLQPNTTYYWNLTNFSPAPPTGTQGCSQSFCDMLITFSKPVGG